MSYQPFAVRFPDGEVRYGIEWLDEAGDGVAYPPLFDEIEQAWSWLEQWRGNEPQVDLSESAEGHPVLISSGTYAVDATAIRSRLTSRYSRDERVHALVRLSADEVKARREPKWAQVLLD